jgi:hypothetical protein
MNHNIGVKGKLVPIVPPPPQMESGNLVMIIHLTVWWRHNLKEGLESLNFFYPIISNVSNNVERFPEDNSVNI